MSATLKYIDIRRIQEDEVSIDKFKNKIQKDLEESSALQLGSTFDSNKWILLENNTQTYSYIHWDKLEDLKAFGFITEDEIILLKCWIAEDIIEELVKIKRKIDAIIDFILETKNFNKDIIKNTNTGDVVVTYITSFNGRSQRDRIQFIKDYIYYLEEKDFITDEHYDVLESLMNINPNIVKYRRRKLPSESDIMTFDYYLKYFYDDKGIDSDMKLMFYPVLIWWKVTNVIPIRPSELCTKLKRDCLKKDKDKYYIKINRSKINVGKNKTNGRKRKIPLLNELSITKDIYDLINEYIRLTKSDTKTKTLFSYKTLKECRLKLGIKGVTDFNSKINENYFTITNLAYLIDQFYEEVMKKKYSIEIIDKNESKELTSIYGSRIIDKLDIGDTRHIAFTSLLLQGVSPIEIAMLGGHTTLDAQAHYQGHAIFYADSEIINLVTQRNIVHESMDTTLKDIVFKMPQTPPRDINKCIPTEDGVGYCMIDLNSKILSCTGGDCTRCNHWWCEPTRDNYIILVDYYKDKIIRPIEEDILVEEAYLMNLLSNKKTISVEGLMELEPEYENELNKTIKRLNRNITLNKFNIKSLSDDNTVIGGLQKMFDDRNIPKMIGGTDIWQGLKEK